MIKINIVSYLIILFSAYFSSKKLRNNNFPSFDNIFSTGIFKDFKAFPSTGSIFANNDIPQLTNNLVNFQNVSNKGLNPLLGIGIGQLPKTIKNKNLVGSEISNVQNLNLPRIQSRIPEFGNKERPLESVTIEKSIDPIAIIAPPSQNPSLLVNSPPQQEIFKEPIIVKELVSVSEPGKTVSVPYVPNIEGKKIGIPPHGIIHDLQEGNDPAPISLRPQTIGGPEILPISRETYEPNIDILNNEGENDEIINEQVPLRLFAEEENL